MPRPDLNPIQPPTMNSDVIPPPSMKRPRTIVLCFDGTGDHFDEANSNVINLFSLLQKDDHHEQVVYYQAGIGTYNKNRHFVGPIGTKILRYTDEAIAWSLDGHVMDGYTFLMNKYQAGDKICFFGFSRGAYTARSLAGMVHKVGLLPAGNEEQVPFAYKMYKRSDSVGWKQSVAFKKAFSIDVDIEFVGVWDTVGSVGLTSRRLPFVSSNSAIRYFRHAVSLDERRAKFKANLYNRPTEEEDKLGVQPGEMPKSGGATPSLVTLVKKWQSRKSETQVEEEEQAREESRFSRQDYNTLHTDVREVWFAGTHGDVGGGCVPNDTRHNLARIPLRWMVRECFKTNTGIRFHASLLRKIGLDPESLYPIVKDRPPPLFAPITDATSRKPTHTRTDTGISVKTLVDKNLSEEEEDLQDALCPIFDQLKLSKAWWILEVLPLVQRYQREDNDQWVEAPVINRGHGRVVPKKPPFYVHRSVKIRQEAQGLPGGPYRSAATFDVEPTYVD
ncbi:hypothetical protein BXZ70DRAFT_29652 [Cristinia sonorae]|uniref:T6SS Phospholipase effector Tle1-like catalytic domain-containing protein n=1 Tax=Cristinia sonorae TaxID=1940300 RepID=A0A8K0XV45_9AGAR|nr:hypothetical protein BXZ70DRAFT_29652 [Cristinia sonorae]